MKCIIENLKGKVAVVTGASSGIGESLTRMLAENNVKVFAVARRKDRLDKLAAVSTNIIPIVQDVTKELKALEDAIKNERIDILVNNAGGALGKDSIQDAPKEKWLGMIERNVTGLIEVSQLIIPKMIKQGSGDVINVGSIAGLQPYSGGSVYCGSKAMVRFMSEAWQQDLIGKGIRVMIINPGLVETEFSIVRFDGDKEAAAKVYENMEPLRAEDVAQNIVWMLAQPKHVNLMSVTIMPTHQASATMVWRN
ncbi:SDR family NAD(P)-dependent oxidoreductase [bacterium]|nr:SDR family NAD(P)-dependent oxidoreductase [bacterium]MBU1917587.1 SDR family NAD(P)-dependent oxidoreductase [bacterium]